MEYIDIVQFIIALAFVATLIYGVGYVLRRLGLEKKLLQKTSSNGRLAVVDSVFIDPRTRLVLVKCDTSEHLILVGQGDPIVVKQDVSI